MLDIVLKVDIHSAPVSDVGLVQITSDESRYMVVLVHQIRIIHRRNEEHKIEERMTETR